jgi:hypothetical protein
MEKERRSAPQPGTFVLMLLVVVGAWPVTTLASQTTAETWAFSAAAAALGVLMAAWLWDRRMRLPGSSSLAWRRRICIAAVVVSAVGIGSAPPGVRMVYSASLEGVVLAIAVLVVRARSKDGHAASGG